ncbi:polysaccharide biosynthesis/export family protein [Moorena producens JHB]|uniref:Polysaccharide biosynthesis/export family protein n=1 Tax=Moorena producens (strain JHB) TaxID=1454205 RepID=A0A1D9G4E2_MOOP1|nr:polysaccharide biosynthesis/export family protein [Moorena producens]AOY82270.1 polysaccharide biosynthesis/export family protein [Moorena producens JHB]
MTTDTHRFGNQVLNLYLFGGTVLFWLVSSGVWVSPGLAKLVGNLPTSGHNLGDGISDRAQLPTFSSIERETTETVESGERETTELETPETTPETTPKTTPETTPETIEVTETLPPPPPLSNPEPVSEENPLEQLEEMLPPLGYPETLSQVSPSDEFNRHYLGREDVIAVSVTNFPNLAFQSAIDSDGNIVVPLFGKLRVVGLTLEAAQDLIQKVLNEFVIDPQVVVSLLSTPQVQITVSGEVFRPGYYPLPPGTQPNQALTAAGGTTTIADLRTILIRRKSVVNNSIIEREIDLLTPLQNGTTPSELNLRDGDAIIVRKLEVGNTTDYDRQLVARSNLAQQQISVRVLSYPNGTIGNLTLANGSTFIDALTAISPNPDDADLDSIALIRFDPEQGKAVTQKLDGEKLLKGDVSQNVPLQDEDVIVVGRSLIAKISAALSVVTRPFNDFLGFRRFFEEIPELF